MSKGDQERWDRLAEFVGNAMKMTGVPGASVGVLYEGKVQTAGFGVTNADHPLDVTDETLHQIGSITKTFTGTLAMRFVETGQLDLDTTVRTYLPHFRVSDEDASSRATIRHLMTHTGGWAGDLFEDTGSGEDALAKYVEKMAGLEQLAPLGTVWSYNNAGFAVLGRILEVVSGRPYADLLREMLLEPIDMAQTHLDTDSVITRRFAVGHRVTADGAQVLPSWSLPDYVRPMGGIICSVKDLLRYAQFHLGDGSTASGERLLSAESLAQMHVQHTPVWRKSSWGLTWSVDDTAAIRRVSHAGGTVGQISLLTLVPERGFAAAVLSNADRGSQLTGDATNEALAAYLDVEIAKPAPIESTEADLRPYVGVYERPFCNVELGMLGGRLIGQITYKQSFPTADTPLPPPPPPFSLSRCEEDRLLVMDGRLANTMADVLRNDDGSIGWLRASGRIHRKVG
jgi:CubicO group peptidase (beta-lactamase class C family)